MRSGPPPAVVAADPAIESVVRWRRLSPRMLVIHPVIELIRALPALAGVLIAGTASRGGAGSIWGLVAAGVVIVLARTRWFTTRYRLTADQVQMRHGLFRRRMVTAPLDRVRSVDVTAHLLHRLLGLARLSVGTGTSDRRGRGRLVLDGIAARVATGLRDELLHTQAAVPGGQWAVAEPEQELARLDVAWIRYAPFTLSGAVTALALLGFGWRIASETRVRLNRMGVLERAAGQVRRTPLWAVIGEGVLVIGLIVAFFSTIGYILAFWNFRLSRHPGGTLQVSRGLITSRATSIERGRLRGAELSEPLLLRAVGGARCLAIATGLRAGTGAERGGTILLPPAPRIRAIGVAGAVIDTDLPFVCPLVAHGRQARRRRHFRALGLAAVLVAIAGVLAGVTGAGAPAWLPTFLLLPIAALLAEDRYRSLGHARSAGYLVTRYGSVARRRCVVAEAGIVGWTIRRTFFQRRLGLTTLTATTAAGRQRYRISDLELGQAYRLADETLPGLLDEFR